MNGEPQPPIRHEPDVHRFSIHVVGATAYISYAELPGHVWNLDHTFVPVGARGHGLASRLTAHALRHARDHGYRVIPSCPFVASYVRRHPEYRDLLA